MQADPSPRRRSSYNPIRYITQRVPFSFLLVGAVLIAGWIALSTAAFSQAQAGFANPAFQATWDRTDGPVAAGAVKRPWTWGPVPGRTLTEVYAGIPGNSHLVQYFDKGRMEINNLNADPKDPFYVTNGLLAIDLISGQLQSGISTYEKRQPATINLASDADDPSAPTYQSFNGVSNIPGAPNERRKASQVGQIERTAIDRQGVTQPWPQDHPDYGVRVAYFEPATGHNIPDVFWLYLNEETGIFRNGELVQGRLFEPWFSVTGYPISEAYWSYVKVEGKYTDVLIQAFERRVLTFVPHLPTPFKVQMGNIGMHYYEWRYSTPQAPAPTPRQGVATPTSLVQAPLLKVTIDSINPRTSLIDLNTNYCTVTNREKSAVRFDGWWIDSPKFGYVARFYFPAGVVLQPGAVLTVHAGRGNSTTTDLYMNRTTVMWDGKPYDLAVLYDNLGREVDRLFPAADGGSPPPAATPPPGATSPPKPTIPAQGTVPPRPTAQPSNVVPSPVSSVQPTLGTGDATSTRVSTPAATVSGTTTVSRTASPTPTPTRAP